MYTPREKVLWFAIVSRITILSSQVIFNILMPDHRADAFKRPLDITQIDSLYDRIVHFLFNGLTRWDGEYFLHIATYGYTYENTLAFYPLYPALIRIVAILLRIFPIFNIQSMMIVAATFINFVCFVKSAIILYDLSECVFENTITAYKASILYCVNPASIFFSAVYSESMFAYLTFYTMCASMKCVLNISSPLAALSTLVRSNGIVNIGFPLFFKLKNLCNSMSKETRQRKRNVWSTLWHILNLMTLKNYFSILKTTIVSLSPLFLLQVYNYAQFCTTLPDKSFLPIHVLQYAEENNLILAGANNSTWCNASLPLAYSYVQKTYWNVGFLKYYQFKQIPNFLLACPILYIVLCCIKEYFLEYKDKLYLLGLIDSTTKSEVTTTKVRKYPFNMFAFVIHGLFLIMSCLFFVHIQVSTRLLASASPLIYWYCALKMSHKCVDRTGLLYESEENARSKWKVFFLSQKQYTLQDKLVLFYFIGYTIVGSFMFSNFFPWT